MPDRRQWGFPWREQSTRCRNGGDPLLIMMDALLTGPPSGPRGNAAHRSAGARIGVRDGWTGKGANAVREHLRGAKMGKGKRKSFLVRQRLVLLVGAACARPDSIEEGPRAWRASHV